MGKVTVVIVIVTWNGRKVLSETLLSLQKLQRQNLNCRTIVVDNNSTDGTTGQVRSEFPDVILLPQAHNLGFAGGNNLGIRKAFDLGADYLWLLNNDTLVDNEALIRLLSVCQSDKKVGGASSKIYFARGREYHHDRYREKDRGKVIWYAGGLVDWDNVYLSHRGVDEVDRGQYDRVEETGFLTGCSMLLPAGVLKKTGLFDERYYLYLEDADLSLRIKKTGRKIMYVPDSVIWHVNAASSGGPGSPLHQYYLTRNRLLFGARYARCRTKLALVRESVSKFLKGSEMEKKAVRDAFFRRFGKGI